MCGVDQPLRAVAARKLAKEIVETGSVGFFSHAEDEMAKDKLDATDVTNVLRGGAYSEAEWENGEWRHHVFMQRIVVAIQFESEIVLMVVTAWRE